MGVLLMALAMTAAMPALAQDVQMINEWALMKSPTACSLGTNSGDTVIAFVIDKASSPGSLRVFNPKWPIETGKDYATRLSFSGADENAVTLRAAKSADGQMLMTAPLAGSVADAFKASDMLSMNIDGIDEFISVNITEGPKIWAAMQTCTAQLPG